MAITQGLILLEGNPILQRLFAGSGPALMFRLMLPGLAMAGLAALAGVHSIPIVYPDGQAEDVGIWWQPNSTLAYTVIVPVMFFAARSLGDQMQRAIEDLEEIDVIHR